MPNAEPDFSSELVPQDLHDFPVHLDAHGSVIPLERFTASGQWYGAYETSAAPDGAAGRLVSMHHFDSSWDSWEMHPNGEELVICVEGEVTLIQEIWSESIEEAPSHRQIQAPTRRVLLRAGEWFVNAAGVWHTADIAIGTSATCIFVTSGLGTEGRPR